MCSGSHRATTRREKRAQRARGEGRGARQSSDVESAFDRVGPGVVRSTDCITSIRDEREGWWGGCGGNGK
eukprot:5451120-Prymnesium_polylepis.1